MDATTFRGGHRKLSCRDVSISGVPVNKSAYNSSGAGATPKLGNLSTVKGLARPGKRAVKGEAASPVSEANGKLARPGHNQKVTGDSGRGTIARPGGNQGISGRGVNSSPTKNMQATTDG